MNRRSFLQTMLQAGVASAFLPGAGRHWVRQRSLFVPDFELITNDAEAFKDLIEGYGLVFKVVPPPISVVEWQGRV